MTEGQAGQLAGREPLQTGPNHYSRAGRRPVSRGPHAARCTNEFATWLLTRPAVRCRPRISRWTTMSQPRRPPSSSRTQPDATRRSASGRASALSSRGANAPLSHGEPRTVVTSAADRGVYTFCVLGGGAPCWEAHKAGATGDRGCCLSAPCLEQAHVAYTGRR